ncbi:MAG: hypothetical protein J3K34DRAFT_456283, partial [Monoraphidium minutum]
MRSWQTWLRKSRCFSCKSILLSTQEMAPTLSPSTATCAAQKTSLITPQASPTEHCGSSLTSHAPRLRRMLYVSVLSPTHRLVQPSVARLGSGVTRAPLPRSAARTPLRTPLRRPATVPVLISLCSSPSHPVPLGRGPAQRVRRRVSRSKAPLLPPQAGPRLLAGQPWCVKLAQHRLWLTFTAFKRTIGSPAIQPLTLTPARCATYPSESRPRAVVALQSWSTRAFATAPGEILLPSLCAPPSHPATTPKAFAGALHAPLPPSASKRLYTPAGRHAAHRTHPNPPCHAAFTLMSAWARAFAVLWCGGASCARPATSAHPFLLARRPAAALHLVEPARKACARALEGGPPPLQKQGPSRARPP